jgi:hypothetical protein
LIRLIAIAGVVWVMPVLVRSRPVTPGEMLWLIGGMGQLTFVVAVVGWYRYEQVPSMCSGGDQNFTFWVFPSVVATLTTVVAIMRYYSVPAWNALFVATFFLLGLVTLEGWTPHQGRVAEEAFMTAGTPVTLGFVGAVAAWLTLTRTTPSAWRERRTVHWLGLSVSLLPFLWFGFCMLNGWVGSRELFVRPRY